MGTGGGSFFVGRTVHARRAYTAALRERTRIAEENQRSQVQQEVAAASPASCTTWSPTTSA